MLPVPPAAALVRSREPWMQVASVLVQFFAAHPCFYVSGASESVAGETPRRCAICVTLISGLASIALAATMSSSVSFGGRPPVRKAPRGGKSCLGAFADQAALKFRQRAEHAARHRRPEVIIQLPEALGVHSTLPLTWG
jgi:hypothetical protein